METSENNVLESVRRLGRKLILTVTLIGCVGGWIALLSYPLIYWHFWEQVYYSQPNSGLLSAILLNVIPWVGMMMAAVYFLMYLPAIWVTGGYATDPYEAQGFAEAMFVATPPVALLWWLPRRIWSAAMG
jgi:hypothetical protein